MLQLKFHFCFMYQNPKKIFLHMFSLTLFCCWRWKNIDSYANKLHRSEMQNMAGTKYTMSTHSLYTSRVDNLREQCKWRPCELVQRPASRLLDLSPSLGGNVRNLEMRHLCVQDESDLSLQIRSDQIHCHRMSYSLDWTTQAQHSLHSTAY